MLLPLMVGQTWSKAPESGCRWEFRTFEKEDTKRKNEEKKDSYAILFLLCENSIEKNSGE